MKKTRLSSSPQRYGFFKGTYGSTSTNFSQEYSSWVDLIVFEKKEKEQDDNWKKNNLEYDLRSTDWILKKVRDSDEYATNLYRCLCNNEFQKLEVIPILKEQRWSCSWRYAGGIIADMKLRGDYIDWYCSGDEGLVTDDIREDLKKLGWSVITD